MGQSGTKIQRKKSFIEPNETPDSDGVNLKKYIWREWWWWPFVAETKPYMKLKGMVVLMKLSLVSENRLLICIKSTDDYTFKIQQYQLGKLF